MHELSLAMEVIDLATREARKNRVSIIREILLEVGALSGVEADAFQWGLEMLIKDTILENAMIKLIRIPGKGTCSACNIEFEMKNRLDSCPECQCFPSKISGGQELRIVSILAE